MEGPNEVQRRTGKTALKIVVKMRFPGRGCGAVEQDEKLAAVAADKVKQIPAAFGEIVLLSDRLRGGRFVAFQADEQLPRHVGFAINGGRIDDVAERQVMHMELPHASHLHGASPSADGAAKEVKLALRRDVKTADFRSGQSGKGRLRAGRMAAFAPSPGR